MAPAEAGCAFVPDRTGRVREILWTQAEGRVGNDNTIKWRGLTLQIPPNPLRPHFVRATVRVHEYLTAAWRSFTGRIGWLITTSRQTHPMTPNWLREPLRQPACGFVDNAARCPQPHSPTTTEAVN